MKLYYSPGACSLGIHVILEEIGKPYELEKLDFATGAQHQPPFSEINPKGKVPTLERDNGKILTEFPAIAFFLARDNKGKKLLPTGLGRTAKALELLDYIVGTVHGRGYTMVFRPANFTPTPDDEDKVRDKGREVINKGMTQLAHELGEKDYLLGEFSVVDAALFYVEFWAKRAGVELPTPLAAHLHRMLERPAVQKVLAVEGLA